MKTILRLGKKIIISAFLLYGYNLLVEPLHWMIPINLITVSVVALLGTPALVAFVLILIYVY